MSRVNSADGLIKAVLGCDDELAATVRKNLGGVLAHRATRAFIAKAWHLTNTTYTVPGPNKRADEKTFYINEGKRMAALFLVTCAEAGMDLDLFTHAEKTDVEN